MPRGAGRRAGVPAGRARDPRGGRGAAASAQPARRRDPAALLAPVGRRAGPRVPPGERAARRARDQRGRDLAHRAAHPLRDRHRPRARQALQLPQQGRDAARREHLAGRGAAARRALRPGGRRHLRAALLGGGLRRAAGVHRSGDAALLARRGDPARDEPGPGRGRGLSRSSIRPARARSPTATRCCTSWARSTRTVRSPTVGRELARLPLDPRVGRMLVAARDEGCLEQVLVIAAALSVQDPRERPLEQAPRPPTSATRVRRRALRFPLATSSSGRLRPSARARARQCRENFLSYPAHARMARRPRAAAAVGGGARLEAVERATPEKPEGYRAIHRALLARPARQRRHEGRSGRQLHRRARHQVLGASGLGHEEARQVDHGRGAGRDHAPLRAHRGERRSALDGGARRRTCSSATASGRTGRRRARQVVALERGTLYGLPVYVDRRVHYGPIDPKLSREIFMRSALVEGEFETRAPFFAHNQRLLRGDRAPRAQVAPPGHPGGRRADPRVLRRARARGHHQRRRFREVAQGGRARASRSCSTCGAKT